MKYLAVLAIALFAIAAADPDAKPEAEADAAAHYYGGYYGDPYRYGGYYGYGRYGYYGHPYGYGRYYGHYLGKRSADAEAEPEADAAAHYGAYYGGYYGYPYGRYYGYGYPYYYHPVAASVSHQHVSTPAATYGVHQIHKREAEAEADPAVLYGLHYPGVAGHPGAATSFVARSPQGARGYYAHPYGAFYGRYYGLGYAGYPYAYLG